MNTLIVYEEVPETTKFYLFPQGVLSKADMQMLYACNEHFQNGTDSEVAQEALDRLGKQLYNDEGEDGPWAKYRVEAHAIAQPGQQIDRVFFTGFIL